MNAVMTLYRTNVGKKVVMAVTGAVMIGWVFAHMLGNMQVFLGAEVLNHYGELIQSQKELLYMLRSFMLAMILLHIWSAVGVIVAARKARSTGYQGGRQTLAATAASRSLRLGGVVVLLFLIWHLLDLTVGVAPVHPSFKYGDVHHNLTTSLARPAVTAFYILANIALGMHIKHGTYSVFQTLGINQIGPRVTATQVAWFFGLAIAGGNITIALACLIGIV